MSSRAQELTSSRVHELTSSRTHELRSSRAHELTSSRAHELTRARAHELTSSRAHELTYSLIQSRSLMNQTHHSTNTERPCTATHRIKKKLSICQCLLCLDLESVPVLSQIKKSRPHSWRRPSVNFFKFQPCDHTPPGTQRLRFLIRC